MPKKILGNQEFADRVPRASAFQEKLNRALNASERARVAQEKLEDVATKHNAELEEQGVIGVRVSLDSPVSYERIGQRLSYHHTSLPLFGDSAHRVSGRFNGLAVVDVSDAFSPGKSYTSGKRDTGDRFVICASVSDAEHNPEITRLVPLSYIEESLAVPEPVQEALGAMATDAA
jgi:hypothetical protein